MLITARAKHLPIEKHRAGLAAVKAATRRLRRWPAASLDSDSTRRRDGQPSGRKNYHEHFALDTNDERKNMP
jgi:hypothetical protein